MLRNLIALFCLPAALMAAEQPKALTLGQLEALRPEVLWQRDVERLERNLTRLQTVISQSGYPADSGQSHITPALLDSLKLIENNLRIEMAGWKHSLNRTGGQVAKLGGKVVLRHDKAKKDMEQRSSALLSKLEQLNAALAVSNEGVSAKKAVKTGTKELLKERAGLIAALLKDIPTTQEKGQPVVGDGRTIIEQPATRRLGESTVQALALKHGDPGRSATAGLKKQDVGRKRVGKGGEIPRSIQNLADSLERDPRLIYTFMRSAVDFQPYFGSVKGAAGTLLELSGNDFDQSSLLIALLEASGIEADYCFGLVRLPMDRAINIFKVGSRTELEAVLDASGIGWGMMNGYYYIQHCFVRARMPANFVAGFRAEGQPVYDLLLSPAIKANEITEGQNIAAVIGFNALQFIEAYIDSGRFSDPLDDYRARVPDYQSLLRQVLLKKERFPAMPLTEDFDVTNVSWAGPAIPDSLRARIDLEVLDRQGNILLGRRLYTDEIWARRLTLSYEPATPEDSAIVAEHGGLYQTPCYLVELVPVLRSAGRELGRGFPVSMAEDNRVRTGLIQPHRGGLPPWEKVFPAGAYLALGMDLGRARSDIGQAGNMVEDTLDAEPYLGRTLGRGASHFLNLKCSAVNELAVSQQIMDLRGINMFCFSTAVEVRNVAGVPQSMLLNGMEVYTGWMSSNPVFLGGEKGGSPGRQENYLFSAAALLNYIMARSPEQSHSQESISALKALVEAESLGVPIYRITPARTEILSWKLSDPPKGGNPKTEKNPLTGPAEADILESRSWTDVRINGFFISGGNGDDVASAGETFRLQLSIKNGGESDVSLVGARISSPDLKVEVIEDSITLGAIPSGQVRTSSQSYGIRFKPEMPAGYVATFDVILSDGSGVNVSAWRFYIQEGKRFFGIFLPDTIKAMVQRYLDQGYGQVLLPQSLFKYRDWEGLGLAALASSGGARDGTGKGVGPGSSVFWLGQAQAGPVRRLGWMTPGMDWHLTQGWDKLKTVFPEMLSPAEKSAYIIGETVPIHLRWIATYTNGETNVCAELPDITVNTSLPPDVGGRWRPGPYIIRGLPFWDRERYKPYVTGETALGPFMLAEVRLALDTINLDGQFDFDVNHKNDLKGYLPHGSEANDGPGAPGPWANRVIACLWGLEEELNGNNWAAGAVNSVKWPGRPWGELPQVEITHQPSSYQGWCSNMGSAATWDFDLQGFSPPQPPTQWTFGNDGMIKLTYGCKDYGGTDEITVDLLVPGWFTTVAGMSVPQDRNNNNIADCWENKYGWVGLRADEDEENKPVGDGTKGDGLAAFDEYRGFCVEGSDYGANVSNPGDQWGHIRTYARDRKVGQESFGKDVFVYDEHGIGLGYFTYANTELVIHKISNSQWSGTAERWINQNTPYSSLKQRGIWLRLGTVGGDAAGYCSSYYPMCPNNTQYCIVDKNKIAQECQRVNMNASETDIIIKQCISHELGHAVGIGNSKTNNNCEYYSEVRRPDNTLSWRSTPRSIMGAAAIFEKVYSPQYLSEYMKYKINTYVDFYFDLSGQNLVMPPNPRPANEDPRKDIRIRK